ncbi:MAG: hypothetical protein HQ579_04385, partial [Candidatus Omnitrophica bacterium]|nr:hypothetical protein [Candidatus Omnitrophota bacterium]
VLVVGDVGYREVEYYRNRKIIPHIDLPINIVARLTPYLGKVLYFLSIAKVYALRRAKFFKEIGIGCKNAEKTISTLAAGFFLYYIFYGLIRPSHFLYLIASYGNEAETLVLKKMKVPVFEYQHGYSFPEQPGYSYSRCLHPLKAKMVIPDKYLWYGKYWEDALVLNGFYAKENIKVIGHPNLSIMKDAEKNKNCILVAAQTGSNEQFMNFLHNYIDRSAYAKNKCFIVKCHPRETAYYIKMWHDFSAKYPDKVKISTESTYKLLMRCHVMLTGTSTVLFEGLYFNCTAYIFTNYLMKHKSSIWKDEFATIIDESYIGDLVPRNISSEMAKTISLMWAPFNGRMLRETLSYKII